MGIYQGQDLGNMVAPGECCNWPKIAAQVMIIRGSPMVCRDERTLHTFLPSTAINNEMSEKAAPIPFD